MFYLIFCSLKQVDERRKIVNNLVNVFIHNVYSQFSTVALHPLGLKAIQDQVDSVKIHISSCMNLC